MTRKASAVMERPAEKITCQHHWLIEPAHGLTSFGICKHCGAKKEFLNVIQDMSSEPVKGKNSSAGFSLDELMETSDEEEPEDDEED